MKNTARYHFLVVLIPGVCVAQSVGQAITPETSSYADLWQKGAVAIVSAILGFLGNYLLGKR